ncbi:chemosensory protein 8 precursor [Bombyx mori]|uniref:Chemosensory protein 8 n=1 Tax=Bombyx mori TaxID=7091 RepID=Q3LB97_BOMMO|nr:chemosensory protein 8 precursor [Bombyx mori]ABH88201.1 chemosensory protein 8 [Bombyx mori]CAJ01456.1 hypothetical protein [Bombyx mori]
MKTILILCALVSVVVCRPEEYYSSQYDNFDVEQLVGNLRLLKNYAKCFLDQGPCTAEGTEFKKRIPEALRTKCAKCNPKQRHLIRTVVKAFQTKLPDLWEELAIKEDPKGQYKHEFTAFINAMD